jgi:cytochrome c oxidase subunit 2
VVETQAAYDAWVQEQLVASSETLKQAVALNPGDLSPDEFLSPYTKDMGIEPEMIHQVHQLHKLSQ